MIRYINVWQYRGIVYYGHPFETRQQSINAASSVRKVDKAKLLYRIVFKARRCGKTDQMRREQWATR